ncbi:MAG: S-layer homology domain-containing protein [Clostridia bacterium]|nr:S-layer homology domain-containing protein [Clostridia bacterium]
MAFAGFSANANALDKPLDTVVDKISKFSSEDRENLMTIVYPFIAVDSGVDILVSMIKNHSSASDTMIDEYIADILKYTSKEDIIFALNSLKIVPENVRSTFFGGFMNGEEFLSFSDEANAYMTEFLNIIYSKVPSLERIITSDGITNGMIARLLRFIKNTNDKMPLMSMNSEYKFLPYYISDVVSGKWDLLCKDKSEKKTIREYVVDFANHLNSEYSTDFRKKISVLLEELGICYIPAKDTDGFKNVTLNKVDKVSYPAIYTYFDNGKMLYKTQMVDKDVSVAYFSDCGGWYKACVTELAYMGVVSGKGGGLFCPYDYVTREEFVKMICAAINLPEAEIEIPFADVDSNTWYAKYIKSAYNYKIVNGQSTDTFGVGKNISRQDAAVICNNILKNVNTVKITDKTFADSDLIAPYALESVYNLSSIGIINGDDKGDFNPTSSITRAESAKIINELIYAIANAK